MGLTPPLERGFLMTTTPFTEIHEFEDTVEAYDGSQTGVPDGHILYIPSEKVVGLSSTWPVAVTVEHGQLHTAREGASITGWQLEGSVKWTSDQIAAAVFFAQGLGYPVRVEFLRCVGLAE